MSHISAASAAISAALLSTAPLLLAPTGASADEEQRGKAYIGKAYIEYVERNADLRMPATGTKAQIEHIERERQSVPRSAEQQIPVEPAPAGGGKAAAWQLALSAALGAAVTGGAVVASRQVSQHGHAVAH